MRQYYTKAERHEVYKKLLKTVNRILSKPVLRTSSILGLCRLIEKQTGFWPTTGNPLYFRENLRDWEVFLPEIPNVAVTMLGLDQPEDLLGFWWNRNKYGWKKRAKLLKEAIKLTKPKKK